MSRRKWLDFRCRRTNIPKRITGYPNRLKPIVVDLTEVRFPAESKPKVEDVVEDPEVGIDEEVRRSFES